MDSLFAKAESPVSTAPCQCCMADVGLDTLNDYHACVDLIQDCFAIQLDYGNLIDNDDRLVCDACVQKLRECRIFKCTIQDTQIKLKNSHFPDEFLQETIKIEPFDYNDQSESDICDLIEVDQAPETKSKSFSNKNDSITPPESNCKRAKIKIKDFIPPDKKSTNPLNRNYICDICKRGFAYKKSLIYHIDKHAPDACPICKKIMQKCSMRRHVRNHNVDFKPFACPHCAGRFLTYQERIRHLKESHSVDIHKHACQLCPKRFYSPCFLKKHVKMRHAHEMNVTCEICGYKCTYQYKLRQHMANHTGVKEWRCDVCDKTFTRKDNLVTHKKIHDNVRAHVCGVCDRGFVHKQTLKQHMRVHEKAAMRAAAIAAAVDSSPS